MNKYLRVIVILLTVLLLSAAPALAQQDIPDCVPIGQASAMTVWRCEDTEYGPLCYINNVGMMFCLDNW